MRASYRRGFTGAAADWTFVLQLQDVPGAVLSEWPAGAVQCFRHSDAGTEESGVVRAVGELYYLVS